MAVARLQLRWAICVVAMLAGTFALADAIAALPVPSITSPAPGSVIWAPRVPVWPDAATIIEYFEAMPAKSAGTTLISAPVEYGPATVRQWPGEGAEEILKYQYAWSVNAVFAAAGVGDTISVTFHRMSNEVDAYGAFTVRRQMDREQILTLPMRAYWQGKSLHVWRGPFYAQVELPADSSASQEIVLQLATELMAVIPIPRRLPPMLYLLPMRVRQIGAPAYHHGTVPEYNFDGDAVTVQYIEAYEQQLDHMLIRLSDRTTAINAYSGIVAQLSQGIHEVREMSQIADHAAMIISAKDDLWSVVQQDEFVTVTSNARDEEFVEALMRMSATNIRIYLLFAP